MSLIEQLGGYDAVKQIWIDGGSLKGTQLEFELLEYRRANNIFESGDKVLISDKNNVYELDYFMNIGNGWASKCGYRFSQQLIERHCTDKEIAQGFRDE